MDRIKQIINQPSHIPIQEVDGLALIKKYVYDRKGVNINPILSFSGFTHREVQLFHKAINHAVSWYKQNPDKI